MRSANAPLGPNAPGAGSPGARKTLDTISETAAQKTFFTRERIVEHGPVLTWARGQRGFTLHDEQQSHRSDIQHALDGFFRSLALKR